MNKFLSIITIVLFSLTLHAELPELTQTWNILRGGIGSLVVSNTSDHAVKFFITWKDGKGGHSLRWALGPKQDHGFITVGRPTDVAITGL